LTRDPEGRVLLEILRDSFSEPVDRGPLAVARFLTGRPDKAIQADVAGCAQEILRQFFMI